MKAKEKERESESKRRDDRFLNDNWADKPLLNLKNASLTITHFRCGFFHSVKCQPQILDKQDIVLIRFHLAINVSLDCKMC